MSPTAKEVIALLALRPLEGEGGYFAETYRTGWTIARDGYPAGRIASTAIYYLVTPEHFSALHRLRGDELYHFYAGDPLDLMLIHPNGRVETNRLGNDLEAGERPQALAPAGVWQGSALAPGGEWALVGTTMTPGFHPDDFELGERVALTASFPHASELIARLTRS